MIWNKGTIIYGVLLVLFIGYYAYCSETGRAIYGFGDRSIYGYGNGYYGSGRPVYVGGVHHK